MPQKSYTINYTLLLLFLLQFVCNNISSQNYHFHQYTKKNGLAANAVYGVMQDHEGFIWIYTESGISKFDGYTFKNFTTLDGLPSNDVWGLTEDSKGRIWIHSIHQKLAYIYQDNVYEVKGNQEEALYILNFYEYKGDVWFENYRGNIGVYLFKSGKDSIERVDKLTKIRMATQRKAKETKACSGAGNLSNPNQGISFSPDSVFYFDRNGKIEEKFLVDNNWLKELCIIEPNSGSTRRRTLTDLGFYLTTWKGIGVWDDNQKKGKALMFNELFNSSLLTNIQVPSYYTPPTFQVSIIPNFGFIEVDSNLNILDTFQVSSLNHRRIFKDREQNLWITTNDDGVYFLTREARNARSFTTVDDNRILSITGDFKNDIFIGTANGGVYQFENDKLVPVIKKREIGNNINGLIINDHGELFIGAERNTLVLDVNTLEQKGTFNGSINKFDFQYSSKVIELSKTKDYTNRTSSNIKDFIWEKGNNTLWYSNRNHVMHANFTDKSNPYLDLAELSGVVDLEVDGKGTIWAGSSNGLWKIENNIAVDIRDKAEILNHKIIDLAIDKSGTIWVGTDNLDLYGFQPDKDTIYNLELPIGSFLQSVYLDYENFLWVGTDEGAVKYRIDRETASKNTVEKIYTLNDGLISGFVDAIFVDSSYIYFGTDKGLTRIDKSSQFQDNSFYDVFIKRVKVNGIEQELSGIYDLTYTQNELEIDFVALSYKSMGNIIYEYQLENVDESWQTTTNTMVRYPKLEPGKYTFKLKVKDIKKIEGELAIPIVIEIHPPFWKTIWFISFVIAAIGGGIYYQIVKIKKRQIAATAINKKIAELELNALQSQMNPHFVFNSLASIQNFIQENNNDQADDYLAKFAKLMRLFLESSKTKQTSLEEELKLINLYVQMEQLRFKERFDFELNIEETIDPFLTSIPTLLLQPFIENSINHGLFHKKGRGLLKLDIAIEEPTETLILIIEDNGIGRRKAKELQKQSRKSYKSRGTQIIEERLEVLRNVDNFDIQINIEDLEDASGTGIGTKVIIQIPYQE